MHHHTMNSSGVAALNLQSDQGPLLFSVSSMIIFWARSFLAVHSDSVPISTETSSTALEILRAKSGSSTSLQFDRRSMALSY
jgi:hypothetical protein